VKWLQRRLNKIAGRRGHGVLGGKPLATDGVFGALTEKVVKVFQDHRGLATDGVVGPKTWAKL
jgi:peptidoglycan hydrolase-like protein with peptidoglycan-binding domain